MKSGLLGESGIAGRGVVDEEVVCRVVVADVNVQITVPVDVHQRGAGPPGLAPSHQAVVDPFESQLAGIPHLKVEAVGHRAADTEDIRPIIPIEITDVHAATGVPERVEMVPGIVGQQRVDEIEAGLRGRHLVEERLAREDDRRIRRDRGGDSGHHDRREGEDAGDDASSDGDHGWSCHFGC